MDLVGFTALSAERGDHGAADVAYRFYGHVRELLPEHRAEEIKTIGERQLHWLKNVPEPVAARPAFEHECSARRPLQTLRNKLARIRPPGQISMQRPEVIG